MIDIQKTYRGIFLESIAFDKMTERPSKRRRVPFNYDINTGKGNFNIKEKLFIITKTDVDRYSRIHYNLKLAGQMESLGEIILDSAQKSVVIRNLAEIKRVTDAYTSKFMYSCEEIRGIKLRELDLNALCTMAKKLYKAQNSTGFFKKIISKF